MVHSLADFPPLIVIGSKGYIGNYFCQKLPFTLPIDREQLDLLEPKMTFSAEGYSYALIAAGMGNPKKCEENPELSYQCNVAGTLALGKELLKRGILPIFLSTDYVYNDALEILPLNHYGRQKALLEQEALKMNALVLRLSKVYGIEKGDKTLFDEMASKLSKGGQIQAATDQVFSPVFVGDIVQILKGLLMSKKRGIFNVTGPLFSSRYEMACSLAKKMGAAFDSVQPITLEAWQDGVKRPKSLKLISSFPGISWQEGMEQVVKNYAEK